MSSGGRPSGLSGSGPAPAALGALSDANCPPRSWSSTRSGGWRSRSASCRPRSSGWRQAAGAASATVVLGDVRRRADVRRWAPVRRPGDRGRVNRDARRRVGAVGRALHASGRSTRCRSRCRWSVSAQLQRRRRGRGPGRRSWSSARCSPAWSRSLAPASASRASDGPRRPGPALGVRHPPRRGRRDAAAIGFALDLDHVGWRVRRRTARMLRPAAEMQRLRSAGRIVAVAPGCPRRYRARAGQKPAAAVYSVAVIATVAGRCRHARRAASSPGRLHHVPRLPASPLRRIPRAPHRVQRTPPGNAARRRDRVRLRSGAAALVQRRTSSVGST